MKYELQVFNKNKIESIQKKYNVEISRNKEEQNEESYIEKERKKVERHKKILEYKDAFDNEKIKEEDIPEEFKEELRKLYTEKIKEVQRKINRT